MKKQIMFHADDFGLTKENTGRILTLVRLGAVNSVSLITCGCLDYAAQEISREKADVFLHINLTEGKSHTKNPLLTDEYGYFRRGFGSLALLSVFRPRALYAAAYEEICAQLDAAAAALGGKPITGIDSHRHLHMLWPIFRAAIDAVKSRPEICRIRIPSEPLLPFLKRPRLFVTLRPVNIVKNILLNLLAAINRPQLERSGLEAVMICGVALSGEMDARASWVARDFIKAAEKRGRAVQFLFHPGYILPGEPVPDEKNTAYAAFHRSDGRICEYRFLESGELQKLAANYGGNGGKL